MAAPIITSIDVVPGTISPGGSAVVTINASDPDARVINLTGVATDSGGTPTNQLAILTIQDLLTYVLTADDPAAVIVQRPATPHVFDVTVP